ncbi:MAG: ATP-binding cassette domain-containing protein [Pseudobdellovibrionaceae bacterium]
MQNSTALTDCLSIVFGIYGHPVAVDNLLSETVSAPGEIDLEQLGLRAGARITPHMCDFVSLSAAKTPLILRLKKDHYCVYVPDGPDGKGGKIHFPKGMAAGKKDIPRTLADIAALYDGQAIEVAVIPRTAQATTDHVWNAHKISWFWDPITSHMNKYTEVLITSFFINLFVMVVPLFSMNVYDLVIPNFALDTLHALVIGMSIMLVFDFLLKTIRSYVLEHIAARVGTHHDILMLEQLFRIRPQFEMMSVGEKANLFRELQGIKDFYASRLAPAVVDLPFSLVFIGVIYFISPIIAAISAGGALAIILCNIAANMPIQRRTQDYIKALQNKSALLIEMLEGSSTIRMFGIARSQLFRWQNVTEDAAASSSRNMFMLNLASNFSAMVIYFVSVFVVLQGVYEIQDNNLTVGGLIATSILSSRMISLISSFAGVAGRLNQTKSILKMVDKVFRLPTELQDAKATPVQHKLTGAITIKDVSYSYPGQAHPALDNINLTVKGGEHIGLIGKSGAGKSTLAHLMAGYLVTDTGTVSHDGLDVKALHPDVLRRSIGIVPQNPFFFSGTVLDNILLGNPDHSAESLGQFPFLGELLEFLQKTGLGYNTPAGEGGIRLSGGQRQAIALARVIIRDPSILIFDEPTTGMDSQLELTVRQGLATFLKDKTFIMVTHRTPLLPLVERLLFMDGGKVVLDGPRDDVLRKLSGQPV